MPRETRLRPALLLILSIAVFRPFLHAGFVSDDIFFAQLYRPDSVKTTLLGAWPHSMGSTDGWRPVVLVSYWLNATLTSGTPAAYRCVNILVHGACAALWAHVVWGLTRQRVAAWVTGVLFVIHPVVHENVIWISGRTYPLAALFVLALCAWTLGHRRRSPWVQHGVGGLLFLGALGSYEFAVVVPAVLGLVVAACHPGRIDGSARRRIAGVALPYAGILVGYLAFRWVWLSDLGRDVMVVASSADAMPGTSIGLRVVRNTAFFLLKLLEWPWFERGSDIRVGVVGGLTTVVAVGSLVLAAAQSETRRVAVLLVGWIGLFFLPVAAYAAITDRFAYLSAAALCAIIGVGTAGVGRAGPGPRAVVGLAVAVMAVGWLSDLRARGDDWLQAGALSRRVIEAALSVEPGPTEPTDLHFVGVPRRHGSAVALITYFPQAVWMRYPPAAQRQVRFVMWWDDPAVVRARLDACEGPQAVRAYAWRPDTQAMQLLMARPGGACVPR